MCRVMVTQGLKWLGLNYSINEVRNRHTFTATTPRLPSYICHYVIESGLQRCANGISAQHHVDPAGLCMCACHSLTHLLTHTLSLSLWLSSCLFSLFLLCFPSFPKILSLLRSISSTGEIKVQGGKDLKMSQHYPPRFGMAVCEWYMDHREHIQKTVERQVRLGLCNRGGFQTQFIICYIYMCIICSSPFHLYDIMARDSGNMWPANLGAVSQTFDLITGEPPIYRLDNLMLGSRIASMLASVRV